MGPLGVMMVNEPLGEWSHFLCEGMTRKLEKGCPMKGESTKGCLLGKTLVEVEFLVEELDHQRGLEPVSHEAQAKVQAQMQ